MSKELNKLREMTEAELREQLEQAHKELVDHRFQTITGHVTDVKKAKTSKRRVARIKTIFKQRQGLKV